jgi:heme exporter protein D
MIELGQHAGFIVSAYAGVGIVIALLIARATLAHRRVTARIKALEARGVRRASEASSPQ